MIKQVEPVFPKPVSNDSLNKIQQTIITSALPYVNNVPHLGNVVGCVLSADCYARWMRNCCKKMDLDPKKYVLFVGGVDEYGTASEMKAREEGISCKELCDRYEKIHNDIYRWWNISFDCYGRTSQPNGNPQDVQEDWPHTAITYDIYKKLAKNGYLIELEERVMRCPDIDRVVADRFIIGTCPLCMSIRAKGDQCDDCGKPLDAVDLINPLYKPDPSFKLIPTTTKNIFINLPHILEKEIGLQKEWFHNNWEKWSMNAKEITNEWLERGLKPRSITRDLQWGTKVPHTSEFGDRYKDKVFYVWFDAPIGYISITEKCLGKESEYWWKNKDCELVQFMAKDNVPFHTIIFPLTLKGSHYTEIDKIRI
jgi:methionyl-tRNA synthetase